MNNDILDIVRPQNRNSRDEEICSLPDSLELYGHIPKENVEVEIVMNFMKETPDNTIKLDLGLKKDGIDSKYNEANITS